MSITLRTLYVMFEIVPVLSSIHTPVFVVNEQHLRHRNASRGDSPRISNDHPPLSFPRNVATVITRKTSSHEVSRYYFSHPRQPRDSEMDQRSEHGEVGCFSHELTMHRGDSFGSRLEDFTSAFHICNDRAPTETKKRENKRKRKGAWTRWKCDREKTIKKRAKKEGERKRQMPKEEDGMTENTSGEAREYGPHLDAWDRHPRSLHQRTDSHRAHAALTYSRVLRRGDSLS